MLRDGIIPWEPLTRQKGKGRILEKAKHSTRREKEVQKEQGGTPPLARALLLLFPCTLSCSEWLENSPFLYPLARMVEGVTHSPMLPTVPLETLVLGRNRTSSRAPGHSTLTLWNEGFLSVAAKVAFSPMWPCQDR